MISNAINTGRNFAVYSKDEGTLTLHATESHAIPIPLLTSLFSLPSQSRHEDIFAITTDFRIIQIHITEKQRLYVHSSSTLPLSRPPQKILPVDPMCWSSNPTPLLDRDVLLSLSSTGELQFWVPEESAAEKWRCTGKVRTRRLGMRKARCSSAKKTALSMSFVVSQIFLLMTFITVVPVTKGEEELTIWDSLESEFASGLEFRCVYE